MPNAEPNSYSPRGFLTALLLLAIPVLGYFVWEYSRIPKPEPVNYDRVLTGYLKRGTANAKLAPTYTDANGDLVADPPTDAAALLDPAELVFTPLAGRDPDTEELWKPFLAAVGKATGKTVKFEPLDDPRAQLAELREGRLHITGFNTGLVPEAVNACGFVPLMALATADGKMTYEMEVIVPSSSPVKSLSDVKGRVVTFGSPGSHSGFKAPLVVLRDEFGLVPGRDFEFLMAGGHRQSMELVGKGGDVIAPVANDLLAEAVEHGKLLTADKYRSVYKSPPFPKAAFGVTHRLKPEVGAKVREVFATFDVAGSPLGEKYRGAKVAKFAPVNYKKDWEFVRSIDQKLVKMAEASESASAARP